MSGRGLQSCVGVLTQQPVAQGVGCVSPLPSFPLAAPPASAHLRSPSRTQNGLATHFQVSLTHVLSKVTDAPGVIVMEDDLLLSPGTARPVGCRHA
jgi:hypothetical protein